MRRARALRLAGVGRRLGPKRSRRILASADERPSAGAASRSSTACAGSVCQAFSLSRTDSEAGFVAPSFIGFPATALRLCALCDLTDLGRNTLTLTSFAFLIRYKRR